MGIRRKCHPTIHFASIMGIIRKCVGKTLFWDFFLATLANYVIVLMVRVM